MNSFELRAPADDHERIVLLVELDGQFPGYGLASHKGYCSAEHMAALSRLGPTPLHRKSYSPVAQQLLPLELAGTLDDLPA